MGFEDDDDICGESSAQAIIEAVERLTQPAEIQLEGDEQGRPRVIALPKGITLRSLKPFEDERRKAPELREGTSTHTTLDSFCSIVERFADEHSALFASDDPKAPRLLAVFDYHEGNSRDDDGDVTGAGAPRWGRHRAVYPFPLAAEWAAWSRLQEWMTQTALAEFLEEHVVEVMDPASVGPGTADLAAQIGISLASPSQLLTLSRGLSLRVDTKVAQHTNLSTGEAQIVFEETHRDRDNNGPVKVPGGFAVSIPVFQGGVAYALVARLRYRVQGGVVTWGIRLHRADQAFRHAIDEACSIAADRTDVPLYYGTPEPAVERKAV